MIKNVVFDIFDVLVHPSDGPIHEAVDLLMELKSRGFPLYAVTNLSTEGFQQMRMEYPFLRQFDGVVVSGSIGLAKPDPRIFNHLLTQFDLNASETLFIDDKQSNVDGAKEAGLFAVRYENPRQLEKSLMDYKVLIFGDSDTDDEIENGGCCGGGCGCH